jgi:hypothetical protein
MAPTLAELVEALERDGRPPPGWTDAILREAWEDCPDAVALARLACRVGAPGACAAAQEAIAAWARDVVPEELRDRRDWATRQAFDAIDEVEADVAACATGAARAVDTLADTCASVVRAAGLRDWDELLAEAAHCVAAPWPDAAYDAMVEHREEMEQAAHRAAAALVRAVVPCPTLARLRAPG